MRPPNALVTSGQLRDEPARSLAGIERELDVAEPRAPLGALAAQRLEPSHPAFVARAPRLDALADPGFFLRPELVELAAAPSLSAASSSALRAS